MEGAFVIILKKTGLMENMNEKSSEKGACGIFHSISRVDSMLNIHPLARNTCASFGNTNSSIKRVSTRFFTSKDSIALSISSTCVARENSGL